MTGRQARVSPAGACLFLSNDELEEAGVDPENDDTVSLTIEHGGIKLDPVSDD